ncbi:MAG: hypothetical protein H6652_00450 [Ardenticatenaceae bacterium]|nr:hypothetical protein [Ardenticatenaceae bacterium]
MGKKRVGDWKYEYARNLRQLEQNPNLNLLFPESGLFLDQIKRLRSLAQEELNQQAEPPRLLLEIVPSLDLYTYEEKYDGINWHIMIPVSLVNSGELPAMSTYVWIKNKGGSMPTFKSETEKGLSTIEPGGFSRAAFFIECVESAEIEIGGRYRSPKNYHNSQEDEYIPFQNLVLTFGISPQETSSNFFVPDRPLLNKDHWEKFKTVEVQTIVQDIITGLNQEVTGRFYEVLGLRRTGKTTILNQVKQEAQKIRWNGNKRKYITAKVDLHVELTKPNRVSDQQLAPSDHLFWHAILSAVKDELPEGTLKKELDDIVRGGVQSDGWRVCRDWLDRIGKQEEAFVLLAIDEADSFSTGIAPVEPEATPMAKAWSSIATGLRTLVEDKKVIVLLAHGYEEPLWEKFFFNTPRKQSILTPRYSFQTQFFSRIEVFKILDQSSLPFSQLAREALWLYTGGYPVLVQILGQYLTELVVDSNTISGSSRPGFISVEDVKRAIPDIFKSLHWGRYIDYLRDGFRNEEQRLMITLATGNYLGLGTNIFLPEKLSRRAVAWHGLERLQAQFNRDHPSSDVDKNFLTVEDLLKRLLKKQILEIDDVTGLLYWRVGLLHSWALYMAPQMLRSSNE